MRDAFSSVLERAVMASGFQLWGHEWATAPSTRILRVYIDQPEGVSIEACVQASRQIAAVLDAESSVQGHYTLEVSSPGISRRFFKSSQYARYIGMNILCCLREGVNQLRRIQGVLLEVLDSGIKIQHEQQVVFVLYSNIDRANLV